MNLSEADKTELLLRKFYEQQGRLRGYVYSATRDYHATEEILQSTAIVVAQKAGAFDFEREEAPWFLGIAKNYIQKHYRAQGKASRNVSLDVLEECLSEFEPFETDQIASRREALDTCLSSLPKKQKDLVQLRYLQGMGCQKIAEKLGRPVQGIYSLLKRLKLELRNCVEYRMKKEEVLP